MLPPRWQRRSLETCHPTPSSVRSDACAPQGEIDPVGSFSPACEGATRKHGHANAGTPTACADVMARILVAEDDPDMLDIIVEALLADGHVVETAPDGGRLLVRLARIHPPEEAIHLVISDLRMPTVTGIQVLQALRASGRRIPVILMTAFGDDDTRARTEKLDAVFFDKPFDIVNLRSMVARLLATATPSEHTHYVPIPSRSSIR